MEIARLKEMPAGGRLLTRRRPEPSPNGDAVRIEVIGDRAAGLGINKNTDILPRLKGKVEIITNDANGQLVEMSVYKTTK